MTKETLKRYTDFIIENHITDYDAIKKLFNIFRLEELLAAAEKEHGIYGKFL